MGTAEEAEECLSAAFELLITDFQLPGMDVRQRDGRVIVEVEDSELADTIDDYLCEACDLEYEWVEVSDETRPRRTTFVFPTTVVLETVVAAMSKLDHAELRRIYSLNNP